ncbi:MAG: S-layer homology domain-containing protein [Candidatus Heteroscillospira sp.]|jgi:poly(3-hydroxybutyrate) depolymerase
MNANTVTSRRLLALLLVVVLTLGMLPMSAVASTDVSGMEKSVPVSDMTVAESVYGWVTTAAEKVEENGKTYVTIGVIPAGGNEEVIFKSDVSYGVANAMTYHEAKLFDPFSGKESPCNSEADIIVSRCPEGAFVEVVKNEADEVIDIRCVLQKGLFFDTAEYGGDLTKVGSEVKYRGLDFKDYDGSTGKTGPMTGLSGAMVAAGWVLDVDADAKTIRIGDGNMTTEVFNETYNVADNVKVYAVGDDFVSTEKALADVPETAADTNGLIYDTVERWQAVVVFDKDYSGYETAEVVEIYYFTTPTDATSIKGLIPQSVRITSDVSEDTQGNPSPRGITVALTSINPITVVDNKMWTVGDIEVNNYLFKGGDDGKGGNQLAMFDFGWTQAGYQYWSCIDEVGEDPRDLDMLLVSHGHGDHYGDAFDAWEMIVRSGNTCRVYETYEDTMGYDVYGFDNIQGMFGDAPFRSIITDWYDMEDWLDLGNGLSMYPILTPGHTQGVASVIFSVTVGEGGMPGARMNATYNEDTKAYDQEFSDYAKGDEIYFVYMGGYGINGLTKLSGGYKRPSFVSSLRYLQSVAPNVLTEGGEKCDAIYNLPQHTNQYAFGEAYQMMLRYNEQFPDDQKPFLAFLNEGKEEVVNFLEKRASALLYEEYAKAWKEKAGPDATKSTVVPYELEVHGEKIATIDIAVQDYQIETIEAYGPYKHAGGETIIQIAEDVEILVMHGYNVFQDVGSVDAELGYTGVPGQNLNNGFSFAKDGNTHDPDAWYVQIGAHVMDDYDGNVYGAANNGNFPSGPVDSIHGEGWSEIIRTEAMTKEQAEALAAELKNGEYYKVDLKKTGDINNADDVMKTFEKVEVAEDEVVPKALPSVEYIIANYPKKDDYYGQYIEGYYNYSDFSVNKGADGKVGTEDDTYRDAKLYVPADSVFNQPTIFIGVPNGVNTYEFMVDSGWKELADEKGLYLVMMEPENGKWSEDIKAENAYMDQLRQDVGKRPFFCTFESNMYGIAYGEAADILQYNSVNNPKNWAAIALVGASGMTAEQVAELEKTDSKIPGVSLADSQTPIWIATEDMEAADIKTMVDFYKKGNHSENTATVPSYADALYVPEETNDKDTPTIIDDWWCANVVVDEIANVEETTNKAYAEKVYTNIMEGTYRYPGNANGALRRPGEIEARGFDYQTATIDGYLREWYVYEPASAKAKEDAGEEVPLVFVFHGAGGTANEIADRSGWAAVADEKGFIIVMPTASITIKPRAINNKVFPDMRPAWNTGEPTATAPSDIDFIEELHGIMLANENYKIDASRVYASGQSSGGMMSWSCAAQLSDLFAAAAPISAYWIDDAAEDATSLVPIACYMGEAETTFRNGFTEDGGKEAIDTYTDLYNTVEKWNTYTYMDDDSKAPEKTGVHGLFTKYTYSTSEDVPMLMGVEVATKTHAIWPSECFDAWENWFENYTKDPKTHTLYYKGEEVEIDKDGSSSGGASKPSINPDPDKTEKPEESGLPFTDVDGHWAEDAVEYVYENKLMNGMSDTKFAPELNTTRGMIVTMLYRLEGSPEVKGDSHFADVKSSAYYCDAVIWAADNGIVKGMSDTTFAPEAEITREQLATMLYNYAKFAKVDASGSADITGYADDEKVSSWALDGVKWAVSEKLVNGVGENLLDPAGDATRAQVATIFQRYMENVAK